MLASVFQKASLLAWWQMSCGYSSKNSSRLISSTSHLRSSMLSRIEYQPMMTKIRTVASPIPSNLSSRKTNTARAREGKSTDAILLFIPLPLCGLCCGGLMPAFTNDNYAGWPHYVERHSCRGRHARMLNISSALERIKEFAC